MKFIGVIPCVGLTWRTHHPYICSITLKLLHRQFFNGNRSVTDMFILLYLLVFHFPHCAPFFALKWYLISIPGQYFICSCMRIAFISARRGVASLDIRGEIVLQNRVTDVRIIERGKETCLELDFHLS